MTSYEFWHFSKLNRVLAVLLPVFCVIVLLFETPIDMAYGILGMIPSTFYCALALTDKTTLILKPGQFTIIEKHLFQTSQ